MRAVLFCVHIHDVYIYSFYALRHTQTVWMHVRTCVIRKSSLSGNCAAAPLSAHNICQLLLRMTIMHVQSPLFPLTPAIVSL